MNTIHGPAAAPTPGSATLLDQRVPGQSVMSELLAVLDQEPPPSTLRRCFGGDPLSPDSAPWYQGALREIEVGKILGRLGPGWTVLHAVPVGAKESDIDHVVIGAPGVFTINTKNHAGKAIWVAGRTLMVSGQKQHHLRNAVHEAARASKLLSAAAGFHVPVAGVIALVGIKSLSTKEPASGTTVLTAAQLRRWLDKRPPVFTEESVASIAASAKQPETWHLAPRESGSPAELQNRFKQVQRRVESARRRRRAWAIAGMAVIAGAAAIAAITLGPAILATVMQTIAG